MASIIPVSGQRPYDGCWQRTTVPTNKQTVSSSVFASERSGFAVGKHRLILKEVIPCGFFLGNS